MCASFSINNRRRSTSNSPANIGDANHDGILFIPSNVARRSQNRDLVESLDGLSVSQANIEQLSRNFAQSQRHEGDLDDAAFDLKCEEFLNHLTLSREEILSLENRTIGQSEIPEWNAERRKRLTASNFGRVIHTRDYTYRHNFVRTLTSLTPPQFKYRRARNAFEYGKKNEKNAIDKYEKVTKRTVKACGLFVHPKYGFLAASPDGLIGEDGILEVKCPYTCKSSPPYKIPWYIKSFCCVPKKDSKMQLKKGHNYYYQIQGQLEITGRKFCDFAVWTPRGIHIERIERDQSFWDAMFPKLEAFYKQSLLPELVDPRISRGLPIREPDFVVKAKNVMDMRRKNKGNQRK